MIIALLDITNEHLTFINEYFYIPTQKYLLFLLWYFLGVFNPCSVQWFKGHQIVTILVLEFVWQLLSCCSESSRRQCVNEWVCFSKTIKIGLQPAGDSCCRPQTHYKGVWWKPDPDCHEGEKKSSEHLVGSHWKGRWDWWVPKEGA